MRYLAKGPLPQDFEQLELRSISLLRALLDHMGDVDLLDVSIFLKCAKQNNVKVSQQSGNDRNLKMSENLQQLLHEGVSCCL